MPVDQAAVEALVARYRSLSPTARHGYNEANTRKDFIEPLFEALGWNVRSKEEVDAEKLVRPGFADYAFLQHGVVRFYLEAKPLEDDIYQEQYARQVITYAYSKGTAWALLTNFARLVVFDALEQVDGGAPRRVLDLQCGDYVSSPDLIVLLTPESLADGSLVTHAEKIGVRRRAIPIEKRLYESMRAWRERLFNDMATALGWQTDARLREGDEAIQRLLDRLIFLRNCEDRTIGEPGLRALRNRLRNRDRAVRVSESLLRLFDRAASTYDSELFQTDALIDVFLRGLGSIVDTTLAEVIEGLYSVPKSYADYDFALIDADVLGQVYEQYLGHVAQRVRQLAARPTLPGMPAPEIAVEAKRERRKQRGIYYTPKWVVDYIVRQTVERFLEEHANDPDAIANLTILDPACGSGSFLIRAYETLLEHHAQQMGGDVGHLDRKMREWVLRHNIFGVDLDPQAVEIARLNLLIRMVREEEELPPLADNIRLGNSLISGGEDELRPYFGDGWREKRPFDWQREFPDIMARGGFDIVLMNPPYRLLQGQEELQAYLRDHYAEIFSGSDDILYFFMARALDLLKPGGYLGCIVSRYWLESFYAKKLRKFVLDRALLQTVVDSRNFQVFGREVNILTCVLVARKNSPGVAATERVKAVTVKDGWSGDGEQLYQRILEHDACDALSDEVMNVFRLRQSTLTDDPWYLAAPDMASIWGKMRETSWQLRELCASTQGIKTGLNSAFVVDAATVEQHGLEDRCLHPVLQGSDISRYHADVRGEYLIYTANQDVIDTSPNTKEYLSGFRARLENRAECRDGLYSWWRLQRPRDPAIILAPARIIVPYMATSNRFTLVSAHEGKPLVGLTDTYHFAPRGKLGVDLRYILGLLNSTLGEVYHKRNAKLKREGYYEYFGDALNLFPVRRIDLSCVADMQAHDRLVGLVQGMLDLHQRLAAKGKVHDNEHEQIKRDIARTDREIDDLVYDLYGLTAGERELVEREMAR